MDVRSAVGDFARVPTRVGKSTKRTLEPHAGLYGTVLASRGAAM
jgi:hypothetical protein